MKILSIVFNILFVAALLLIGFFFSDMTNIVKNQMKSSIAIEDTCQLSSQTCTQHGVDIRLQKDILTPLEPSSITVKWPNTHSEKLLISLQAVDMEMGDPIFQLTKTNDNTFEGEILLPICTQDTMMWTGTLTDGNLDVTISLKAQQ
ncbi:hypothetical protein PVK62_04280 [Aliivibrio sp. S3MY1]|uniref:hypothetical protein n=1 Tax=unclassified Aliivibrio TaxID=2645654 RepID=UPI0023794093|nr:MULTISPECIES: hypothetical protein [unclassified Aliivibrio]MDD9195052.1 hypothetical protein [Aliivibrio sp. S3MY1]MDD9198342.1 hypothetical protein [Aliivibrio sp. S2MY1]